MESGFQLELARHIDGVRRRAVPRKADVVTAEVLGGWLTVRPGWPVGEFASASLFRVYWLTQREKLSGEQMDSAVRELRRLKCERAYVWLAPWAWDESVEAMLAERGARVVPWVEYIALARRAEGVTLERPCVFRTRRIERSEAERFFEQIAPWYGEDGATMGVGMVRDELEEAFGAFEGERPVGVGMLAMDRETGFGYLGAAGTDPEFRGRGAQSALIAARVERTRELGATWCSVETNTAVGVSLRNLQRCGFVPAISWRVYSWRDVMEGRG